MQKIGTEMCKPECRAWRKHVDKNKERNRRDLSTQRLGQNQSFIILYNENLLLYLSDTTLCNEATDS